MFDQFKLETVRDENYKKTIFVTNTFITVKTVQCTAGVTIEYFLSLDL